MSAESRVGPRAAAWVRGEWQMAEFRAPALAGRAGIGLSYGLYIPPEQAARAAQPMPLVVMLHGCAQSAAAFARGTRMNVLADEYHFAVLYPQQSEARHPHACWHWYDPSPAGGGAEAWAVAALAEQVVQTHGLDASRVYVAGLSAGAGLAGTLAFEYPEQFAAVAVHSGVVLGEARSVMSGLDAMRRGTQKRPAALARALLEGRDHPGMPVLLMHGMADDVVQAVNLQQLETQFLELNGLLDEADQLQGVRVKQTQREGVTCRDYERDGKSLVRAYQIDGLSHAWSGGDDTVPFHAAHGPEASREIWRFFQAHQRVPVAVALDE